MVQSPAFTETEQSRTKLMGRLISARIRSAPDRHFAGNAGALVSAEVNSGQLILSGPGAGANYIP